MMTNTMRRAERIVLWHMVASILLATFVVSSTSQAADPAYQLMVATDRPEAIYEMGEEARFVVQLTRASRTVSTGAVAYVVDDFITEYPTNVGFPKGELDLSDKSRSVPVTADRPTFLRCRVSYRTPEGKVLSSTAAAAFSPEKIGPSLPVPDDFDRFWSDQKKQLAAVPMDAQLTPVSQSNGNIQCYDIQLACLGGAPVSGYLALPADAKPKSLPAVLWVHGAGVRSSSLGTAIKGAAANMLSLDINAHGIANGKPAEFYRQLTAGRLKDYRHAGRDDRETVYFRGMFLRLVRAIDFLTSRPQWDGKAVVVIGHSQGGGQALVAGGIDDRVTMIASGVPAICDHSGRAAGRINGWPKLVPTNSDGKPDPTIVEASRYVDAVNFASRCRAEAIMSVGFIDNVCPPSSCYAAYNLLSGTKQIITEPLMGHAAPEHIQDAFFQKVLEHVARKPQ